MPVDVRLPIGGLFLSVGLLLLVYGVLSGLSTTAGRLDAGWGVVMIISGAILGYYGIRSRQRTDTGPGGPGH